jgi:hypothetical protein
MKDHAAPPEPGIIDWLLLLQTCRPSGPENKMPALLLSRFKSKVLLILSAALFAQVGAFDQFHV